MSVKLFASLRTDGRKGLTKAPGGDPSFLRAKQLQTDLQWLIEVIAMEGKGRTDGPEDGRDGP